MENFEFENKKKKKIKKDAIYLCLCVVCLVIGGLGGYFVHDTFLKNKYHKIIKFMMKLPKL